MIPRGNYLHISNCYINNCRCWTSSPLLLCILFLAAQLNLIVLIAMDFFYRQLLPLLIATLCLLLTADAFELNPAQISLTGNRTNSIHNNSSSVTVKFECPSKFGYYASADGTSDNMTKFWLCVNWEPHEFNCPRGTHFNVHENQCTEWISENSTKEDASEVIQHLEHDGEEENKHQPKQHHHKKSHRNHHQHHNRHHRHPHHQHKSGRHHLHQPHPAVVKELTHQQQQLERMHRRLESIDDRLDSLYAYVDSKLRQSKQHQQQQHSNSTTA